MLLLFVCFRRHYILYFMHFIFYMIGCSQNKHITKLFIFGKGFIQIKIVQQNLTDNNEII